MEKFTLNFLGHPNVYVMTYVQLQLYLYVYSDCLVI